MLALLLRALAHLPLRIVQTIGIGMGWIIYWASSQYRQTLKDNIRQNALYHSHTDYTRLIRASIVHQGIAGMELPYMWCHSLPHLVKLIRQTTGMHYIEQALTQDAPLVFVLPHLGCIDICGLYLSASLPRPTTAMYRPPKIKSLEQLMKKGRDRHTGATAPANIAGIRILVRALKNKEAIIILPDQAPTTGEGVCQIKSGPAQMGLF